MASSLEPFTGQETFAAPQERAFAVLTDLEAVVAAMPGLVSSERVDERAIKAVVRPGLSFLGGQVRQTLRLVEADPPRSALMRIDATSVGVSMSIETRLSLSGTEGGRTLLDWQVRVFDMNGLITAVPAGLIRAAAEKVISDGWKALTKRIEAKG